MSDEKKRSRGKPKRYENEESERLSVLVRPRYKKIIETILACLNSNKKNK